MTVYYPYATNSLLPIVMASQPPLNTTGVNTFFDICRVRRATALFNWNTGSKYALLISSAYTFDQLHSTIADIPSDAIGSIAEITQRAVNSAGWCCSVGIEFLLVDPLPSLLPVDKVIFAEGNTDADKLICCFTEVVELPFEPDGRTWVLRPNASQSGGVTGSGGWFA